MTSKYEKALRDGKHAGERREKPDKNPYVAKKPGDTATLAILWRTGWRTAMRKHSRR